MSLTPEQKQARAALLLGRGWLDKGRDDIARQHFTEAARLWPGQAQPWRHLAWLAIRAERFAEALDYLAEACRLDPGDARLAWEREQVQRLMGPAPVAALPSNPDGRLRFRARYDRRHHRSGWRYAVGALYPLHNEHGVRFEHFIEEPFAWQHQRAGIRSGADLLVAIRSGDHTRALNSEETGILPIREPWCGILHNPPHMPAGFHPQETPQAIMAKPVWRDSLPTCVGLFTLSEYAAQWLREVTGKPVSTLVHPTEIPDTLFDFEAFLANPHKKLVQVGWWLRRLGAIHRLPIPADNPLGLRKLRLVPAFFHDADRYLADMVASDGGTAPDNADDTEVVQHLPDADYDRLLARNIVFIQLYDASANNTVIECLARGTPLLVNPLPAVREYLGDDYPLYYTDLPQAAAMALDLGRLREAHQHLLANPVRMQLGGDAFRAQMVASEVYRLL